METMVTAARWLRSIGTRAKGFWHLPMRYKRAFAWAIMMLPITRLGLRMKGMQTTQRWLNPRHGATRTPAQPGISIDEALQLGRVVNLAARHGVGESNCLPRSLVLWSLLRRHQVDADLRIGVGGSTGDGPRFHAWVEAGGVVVNDAPDVAKQYLPFKGTIEPGQTRF